MICWIRNMCSRNLITQRAGSPNKFVETIVYLLTRYLLRNQDSIGIEQLRKSRKVKGYFEESIDSVVLKNRVVWGLEILWELGQRVFRKTRYMNLNLCLGHTVMNKKKYKRQVIREYEINGWVNAKYNNI